MEYRWLALSYKHSKDASSKRQVPEEVMSVINRVNEILFKMGADKKPVLRKYGEDPEHTYLPLKAHQRNIQPADYGGNSKSQ